MADAVYFHASQYVFGEEARKQVALGGRTASWTTQALLNQGSDSRDRTKDCWRGVEKTRSFWSGGTWWLSVEENEDEAWSWGATNALFPK